MEADAGRWLIFADQRGMGLQLATLLQARGAECILVLPGERFDGLNPTHFQIAPDSREDMEQLVRTVSSEALAGVVYLWGMDRDQASDDKQLTGMADNITVLHLVQSLSQSKRDGWHKLALITCGAQFVTAGEKSAKPPRGHRRIKGVGQTTLWGLGRVIANEHPELGCMLVDMDGIDSPESCSQLVRELLGDRGEPEVALRVSDCYVHRLDYAAEKESQKPGSLSSTTVRKTARPDTPFVLTVAKPGLLDSLTWQETERRPPGAGEIELEVHAAPLNFKDLMKVMNLLSEEYLDNTFFGQPLGAECAGVVVRVGEGVDQFRVGDSVVAPEGGGCFRSYHTVRTQYAVSKPTPFSFEESVIFINFIAPYYGLYHIARLQPGEKVLIHSATGGVGLAAIQIARWRGAEIYATAGSEEKRAYLRSLGINDVSDSRSLQFVDDILTWTDGEGVDVVLNTLSGEALRKSFSLLAPYGRFIELGKRDIHDNSQLAMAAFDRNLLFAAIDIDLMMAERPRLFRQLLDEVWHHCEEGTFKPLPMTVFPATKVEHAFRYMAQAKHIGKVVVSQAKERQEQAIRADGSYLITGGLGALGRQVAHWLIKEGARHLVLMGRSASSNHPAVRELEEAGAQIVVVQADVANREDLKKIKRVLAQSPTPLRGIVHAAGVLDDGVLMNQSAERFAKVMAPKVQGTWNLHLLSQESPLDFFVCFSSAASLVGSPGQANYAAANAFMDGLMHHRHAQGLPGLSINWGPWAEEGMAAKQDARWAQFGMHAIAKEQGLQLLSDLIKNNQQTSAQMGVLPVNWPKFMRVTGSVPFLEAVAPQPKQKASDFLKQLKAASDGRALLISHLRSEIAKVLGITNVEQIELRDRLFDLGLDSLMAIELKNRLEANLELTLQPTLLFDHPTLEALGGYLAEEILGPETTPQEEEKEEKPEEEELVVKD